MHLPPSRARIGLGTNHLHQSILISLIRIDIDGARAHKSAAGAHIIIPFHLKCYHAVLGERLQFIGGKSAYQAHRLVSLAQALKDPVSKIVDAVRATLDKCEPELAADLVDRGLVLSGGSSQLKGLDKLLSQQTGLPVTIADDPLSAVAEGTGVVMNELDFLEKNKRQ